MGDNRTSATVGDALFDASGLYRYALWRRWDAMGEQVVFILLNPSAADAARDDATIRRCLGFSRRWGFGALAVVNLFAWRTANPRALARVTDPIGPDNDRVLAQVCRGAGRVVVGWGNHGALHRRDQAVLALIDGEAHCLGLTRRGQPCHPLYLPGERRPEPLRAKSTGRTHNRE
ncbi:DUF1643 domain-containing protein [Gloeobacter violaceus]|uniref:Gll0262 protein n=1 Tax=Gloeobacter violaceus (strain ATCC 29082 / PCC 7421) TaxID=251221 RepID=Q7NNZ6_GLOVI|nr:DUF1643 domain-containing protein [Gloeobacter violaceus]BAC88203.1 gll0262 [Gloeobacter violaceus PCC 7421]